MLEQTNQYFPSATLNGDITPEYLGVGYIIGPRIAGVLVAGGVLAWLGLIPLLASLVPPDAIAAQLVKLGYLRRRDAGGQGGWDPATHTFASTDDRDLPRLRAADRRGRGRRRRLHHALKTLPTIVSAFKEQRRVAARRARRGAGAEAHRARPAHHRRALRLRSASC